MIKMLINKTIFYSGLKNKIQNSKMTSNLNVKLFTVVYLALGSNLGNRYLNFQKCVKMIEERKIGKIEKTSQIYQSPCIDANNKIVKEENKFLNAVVKIETDLCPMDLLIKCKEIEAEFHRKEKVKYYEAREIDIDILLYGDKVININDEKLNLNIPHMRLSERLFVLRPLLDINKNISYFDRDRNKLVQAADIFTELLKTKYNILIKSEEVNNYDKLAYLSKTLNIKLNDNKEINFDLGEKTLLMGVINCTPDSFSGGLLHPIELTIKEEKINSIDGIINLLLANKEVIDIIDIGGESTRPGSNEVNEEEELNRVSEVIKRIRNTEDLSNKVISIDTRKASVARECVKLGANIINDVSGSTYDSDMISLIKEFQCNYICMHARAQPKIMQSKEYTTYSEDCINEINKELTNVIKEIKSLHDIVKNSYPPICDWNIIIDPGLGFSKLKIHNLKIINELEGIKNNFSNVLLMAHSKKKFIQDTLQVGVDDTLIGDAVVAGISIIKGANIIRAHDFKKINQAIKMSDAIHKIS